jgi:hypothetical protein
MAIRRRSRSFAPYEPSSMGWGPNSLRTSRSQVAFARRRGFAWLWLSGTWLRHPTTETVLSVALGRHDRSPRFKEVVNPSSRVWMHHLEVHDVGDIDNEVAGWLREA